MAIGSIEFTTISRAQDYSTMKQNEDNKPAIQQAHMSNQMQKTTEQRRQEVYTADDTAWHENRPDAREKGNGKYEGDGGQNRKSRKDSTVERVVVKGQGGFDIKI